MKINEKTVMEIAKNDYLDELKEIILLDALYVQSENIRYYDKANDLKWSIAVEITDGLGLNPEDEEYYNACDETDLILGEYIDSKSYEILENVLDNIG